MVEITIKLRGKSVQDINELIDYSKEQIPDAEGMKNLEETSSFKNECGYGTIEKKGYDFTLTFNDIFVKEIVDLAKDCLGFIVSFVKMLEKRFVTISDMCEKVNPAPHEDSFVEDCADGTFGIIERSKETEE